MMKLLNNKTIFTLCAGLALILLPGCESNEGIPSDYSFSGDEESAPPLTPPPEGEIPPEEDPTIKLSSFQVSEIVIGQPDFNTTEWNSDPVNAKNYSSGMYSNAIVVNQKLYIGDEGFNRVLGYNAVPQTNGMAADFVLGQVDFNSSDSGNAANEMSSPHIGAYTDGRFFIAEYSASRVLIYNTPPTETNTSADLVIGETDFGVGNTGGCFRNKLNSPEAISAANGKLVISDSSNNRILIYNTIPTENNASADIVLGQSDFTTCSDNRGNSLPSSDTLNYPAGIWTNGEKLVVNDQGNHRILIWNSFPTEIGQNADIVLGQSDFNMSTPNDDNQDGIADSTPSARTLSGPMNGLFSNGKQIFSADIGNNRVLIWNEFPTVNFQPANIVLGQNDFNMSTSNDDNQDGVEDSAPSARTLSDPNGLYQYKNQFFIMDDNNARVLIFNGLE